MTEAPMVPPSFASEDLVRFLAELTDLSNKFGIAINGNPELYVMTDEDRSRVYLADNDSRLCFE